MLKPSYLIVFIQLFPTIQASVRFWHSNCLYSCRVDVLWTGDYCN